ncbi:MAG TPA: hypothetical protein VEQ60_01780 [Longimicrobium sp.]|nr:hypothetical protein [Longimicrobium sp.]
MVNVSIPRALPIVALLAGLAACADQPTEPPVGPDPTPEPPAVLGVYHFTLTGIDGSGSEGLRANVIAVPDGSSEALNPNTGSLAFEVHSSSSFVEGVRPTVPNPNTFAQRFITVTYRVRNSTGAPVNNLTFIPVIRSAGPPTIAGTPFTSLLLFNGAAGSATLASQFVPTGAVAMGEDARLRSLYPDVLQVFTEAEVAAIPLPANVTSFFPYGFMVRNATTAGRTIPVATGPNDFGGLLTFAMRYPITSSANTDPFTIGFSAVAVEDTETRMTESIEERQDTAGVRRARERATALGATTVTVLAGSPAADPFVTDYPGQRQICSVRTSGTSASPTNFITDTATFTELAIYRSGEVLNACNANYTSGTPTPANYGLTYQVALRAMDRYGNVRTNAVDTLVLTSSDGTAVMPAPAPFINGLRVRNLTYTTYGNSTLTATGRRLKGVTSMFVNGMMRLWDGDIDTNWFTDGDWTQNYHPGVQDSVTIPGDRPFYPLLVQNTTTRGVTMTPGTTTQPFINLSSFDLTVAGDVALGTTGTFTGTGRLVLTGTSNTVGGGISNFDVRNLRITDTGRYSASSNLNVTGGRIVVQGGRLRSQGYRVRVRPN